LTPQQTTFIFEELLPGFVKRALATKTNNLKYALLISESINQTTTFFNFCLDPQSPFKDKISDISDAMRTVFDI
jgi:hypothetical protein